MRHQKSSKEELKAHAAGKIAECKESAPQFAHLMGLILENELLPIETHMWPHCLICDGPVERVEDGDTTGEKFYVFCHGAIDLITLHWILRSHFHARLYSFRTERLATEAEQ